MHELTFRICVNKGKINPYYFEMANIREQCSWVHQKDKAATKLTEIAVGFAMSHFFSLFTCNKRALVIGGGIAGIQASLDLGDAGLKLLLCRKRVFNRRMSQLDKTFQH